MPVGGRCEFRRIVVEVTEVCNHACLHCYRRWRGNGDASGISGKLSRSQIRNLVRKVKFDAPLEQVALSGGEPMLREDLPEIICDLADEGLTSVVITNGSRLTAPRLRRFPTDSVFEVTLFSADASLHDRIAGRPAFGKVIEGLVRLQKQRCRFVLACVITKLNAHDTKRTIELGIALGAEAVLLNRVNLSRLSVPIARELVADAFSLEQSLDAAEEAAEKYGIAVAVSVPIPPCVVDPRRYSHLHFGWCPRGNEDAYYTIGPDGLLRPCNHSSVILGDLRKHGFRELVLGEKAKEFWTALPAKCAECEHPLSRLCRGGCPAASDECYGSRERVDPIVEFSTSAEKT